MVTSIPPKTEPPGRLLPERACFRWWKGGPLGSTCNTAGLPPAVQAMVSKLLNSASDLGPVRMAHTAEAQEAPADCSFLLQKQKAASCGIQTLADTVASSAFGGTRSVPAPRQAEMTTLAWAKGRDGHRRHLVIHLGSSRVKWTPKGSQTCLRVPSC